MSLPIGAEYDDSDMKPADCGSDDGRL